MTERVLYGLVLAGGESRRMGTDKATLSRDGRSQLAWLVEMLTPHVEQVFVSTRVDQVNEPERSRFPRIVDAVDAAGPVAGILSALEAHPQVDWMVVACDLPNVDDETLQFLKDNRSASQPFTAFESSHDSLPEPLCAIYGAGSGDTIRRFVAEDIICPRKILIRSDTRLLKQPNPRALENVNTPEDLNRSVLEANA